ncbi:FTR1 family iron permease [Geminisphaera colitermitum]|uniref:FTR1 family iron permease n=1 Tax=Geminisphaera colitermitum TaxID=1148786 RepID=UPI0009E036F2|nr:FTR1 family protein [Geminisphaera colitermitum]
MAAHAHHTPAHRAFRTVTDTLSTCRLTPAPPPPLFLLIALLAFAFLSPPAPAQPAPDAPSASAHQRHIEDIKARLDKTSTLYAQKQIPDARQTVQMAYFEVFENLEGPIRINISARKSAQLEATFGEIRRMIGDARPQAEVDARIAWLKQELDAALPILDGGHQLVAQAQHDGHDNDAIAPYWKKYLQLIDDRLAESVTVYQENNYALARERILQAQFDGFKNSELEIAVRRHRSTTQASAINLRFSNLIALAARPQPPPISEYGYEITTLLQEIADQLPSLPLVRPEHAITPDGAPDPTDAALATQNATPDRDWHAVSGQINTAIAAAIATYQTGDAKAGMTAVQDAYFDLFEATGMENKVGARDTTAKTTIEGYFTRLVSLMKAGRPAAELTDQATLLAAELQKASATLGRAGSSPVETFLYSLLIILREGLEALLIVAAIVAYLIKNNHRDKLPLIRNSVLVALAASVLTAILFQWLFANSGASRELLEGFTMIAAVIVLFFMSYWLLSKTEARHWKAYLEGKLTASLTRGSLFGLWFASFLAVYREGAETVLFYFALFGDAGRTTQGALAIGAGFAAGSVLLAIVYFIMRYSVVRLPLKPFFLFTGIFLYFMAFVFAGKSVLELIEGKLIHPTLIPGVPEIGWLGIYPYRETLAPQALLLLAALFALWVMRRRRDAVVPPSPAATLPNHSSQ